MSGVLTLHDAGPCITAAAQDHEARWRLSAAERADIAARASTPAERRGDAYVSLPGDAADALAAGRWARWCGYVSKEDEAKFLRVLEWRRLDAARCRESLRPARLATPSALPPWTEELRRMLDAAAAAECPTAAPYLDAGAPLPNQALFAPFVEAAARGPRGRLAALGAPTTAAAAMERRLLSTLTQIAGAAIETVDAATSFPRGLLLEFPVLARMLARAWSRWIVATEELLARLETDRAELAAFLGVTRLGPPVGFSVEDADSHNGGRTVAIVTFRGGARAVYKPRDMALDIAFAGLIDTLRALGLDLGSVVPDVLRRDGYGWCAFIAHRHAENERERATFWQRAGALLGVLTALGGTDMHCGNVIAAGDRLVLVDLETVLKPTMRDTTRERDDAGTALGRLIRLLESSAIATGMLPVPVQNGHGQSVDVGALSSGGVGARRHSHLASDLPPESEILRFHADLRAGFQDALRLMRTHRDVLLADGGALDRFAGAPTRLLFRDTNLYFRLMMRSCEPELLRDGADRDVALEQLARMLAPHAERPPTVGVVDAEKRALEALDIPRFDGAADGLDLNDAIGPVVAGLFERSALDAARDRLRQLNETDEIAHLRILDLAMQARVAGFPAAPARPAPGASSVATGEGSPLAAAQAIELMLRSLALEGADGSVVWLAPRHDVAAGAMTMTGGNQAFGEGRLGIVLFLAALARVSGVPFAACLAGQAAQPPELKARYRSLVAPRLGVVEGLGGQVWGYTALARVGGPDWCLDAAADAFTTGIDQLNATEWTVADGLAGLLLGGLALRARAPALVALDSLDALAHRVAALATAAVAAEAGLLTGLTGAGLALARAAVALDAPALRGAAWAALAAEGEAGDGIGWGRGAAGRFLARQAAMKLLEGGHSLATMNRADASAVAEAGAPGCDGLWRGGAGLLPAMASVDPQRAVDMQRQLCARAAAGRLAPVAPALPGVAFPGLLNGLAGIGYTLLRTVDASLPDLHLLG